jgi:Uma2 family endonuclease
MSAPAVKKPLPPPPRDSGIGPRRWTREEYYRAAKAGVFGPEERLELLDGEILQKMSAQLGFHAGAVAAAVQILSRLFGSGYHVRPQLPLILGDQSEPEPDVVVVAGSPFDYLPEHPHATDVRLVVEVSDTTLRFDRGRKQAAYARSGISDYWIVNLPQRQLEVYRDPSGSRYRTVLLYREDETASPLAAPHATVRVAELLPPATAAQSG